MDGGQHPHELVRLKDKIVHVQVNRDDNTLKHTFVLSDPIIKNLMDPEIDHENSIPDYAKALVKDKEYLFQLKSI